MFKEFFLFELSYRKSRSATYVYFVMTFLLCFLGVASPVIKLGGAVGMIAANAPYVIYRMTIVSSFALSIISSAVMGVTIVRDFDHNMSGILFSMPITKWDYLMGRFSGSFVVLLLIQLAIPLGFIAGFALGPEAPWEVSWRNQELLSFSLWSYVHPFLLIIVPNLFVTSSLFFTSGALGRKSIVIYMQGILLVVIYQVANNYLKELDSQYLAAIIDPFAVQSFLYMTQYWTPAEQNVLYVPLEGPMLLNRILWIGIGILALLLTYRFFSFVALSRSTVVSRAKKLTHDQHESDKWIVPKVRQTLNSITHLKQIEHSSLLFFKMAWKEIPFLAIVGSGILLLVVNATKINSVYGTSSYPTTAVILDVIKNSFSLFFSIIVIFYTGEMIWKERSVNFNMITDALPVPSFINLISKFIALLLIYATLIVILIGCGVAVQISLGYFKFELQLYLGTLFGATYIDLILFTLLAFFIQVMVNNKFTGFIICILVLIINILMEPIGVEHNLLQFGSGSLETFSEINQYGHFVTPFSWFKIYWISFSFILFALSIVFFARGAETLIKLRWKAGQSRVTRPLLLFTILMCCIFFFSGFYIYYNTNIVNIYEGSGDRKKKQADYERLFDRYKQLVQPKIVESNITVDLFPSYRRFNAQGYYYLKNKSLTAIKDIHVQYSMDHQLKVSDLYFDRPAKLKQGYPNYHYYIYELNGNLLPGDSVKMDFKLSFTTQGFVEGYSNTDVVYNGTFFNNSYFPRLGYNTLYELTDSQDRIAYGLKERDELAEHDDPKGKTVNVFGDDADHIRFETVVSTENDQIAIAPGTLQKKWSADGRNYFQYKAFAPIANNYFLGSGRYKVKRDRWHNVDLEIYYHPGHEYNLDNMMKGIKDALTYYSKKFSSFQYQQLRIAEFPRYHTFTPSYASIIPYSEDVGFMLKMGNANKELDMAYYVTVHEVAHQWWGQQVLEANTKGSALLSEGMSQYSALMVLKTNYSTDVVEQYLNYELDSYLKGRTQEKKEEPPLVSVENQRYVSLNKSSLVFFALQDYIGEDSLTAAFSRFNETWAFKDEPYPVSDDLLNEIRKVTPDTLQYVLHDLFETVTLFENRSIDAVYQEVKKGKFELTLSVSCEKLRVDSQGKEKSTPLNDWIDIGIYGLDEMGKEKLVYLKKHKIEKSTGLFTILINQRPIRAGIDPVHKLIDRHADDNTIPVAKTIGIIDLPIE